MAPVAIKMTARNRYPGVEFGDYTLLTRDKERDSAELDKIIDVKTAWTHAMQTKARSDFELVLARNFTLTGGHGFMTRQEYIDNRVNDPSKTARAVYENVVLQIFGDIAVLSYRVTVAADPPEPSGLMERMAWIDVLAKEDGNWKIMDTRMSWLEEIPTSN